MEIEIISNQDIDENQTQEYTVLKLDLELIPVQIETEQDKLEKAKKKWLLVYFS